MSGYDFDLLVIGAGSGGVRASRKASAAGLKVAVVESAALGGTCVNIGCVPKKLFAYAAEFPEHFELANSFGWDIKNVACDWNKLKTNKDKAIERLNGIYEKLLVNAGVEIIHGSASFQDAHTVRVNEQSITAEKILIATGGKPKALSIPGGEHALVSDHMFYLDELPKQAVIIGGGYIALEFASILNGLGSEVTVVYRGDMPLRGFDNEVRAFVLEQLQHQGINVRTQVSPVEIIKKEQGFDTVLSDSTVLKSNLILAAIGRTPNVQQLNLEAAGVTLEDDGAVVVDEYFQTSAESIYAIGDVINRIQLTPVAIHEAMALVNTLARSKPTTVDYSFCPKAVFCSPNIATVGYTEQEAAELYDDIRCYKSQFNPLRQSFNVNKHPSFMKLIVDVQTGKVIGAHMAGEHAAEIIQGIAVAIKAGATKADFDATIGIHPTSAEEFVTMS